MLQVPYVACQLNTGCCDHIFFCKLLPFSFSAALLTVSWLHGTSFVYFLISIRQVTELINKYLIFVCVWCVCVNAWTLLHMFINPSAWGYLKPSQYCDVGRFFYGLFKF